MAFQNLDVVDAIKAGPAALLDLASAVVVWDDTTYAEGLEFANDGKTFLYVQNGAAGAVAIGWIAVADPDARTETLAPSVAAGDNGIMGAYLPLIWNSALGRIQFLPDNNDALIKYIAIKIDNPT